MDKDRQVSGVRCQRIEDREVGSRNESNAEVGMRKSEYGIAALCHLNSRKSSVRPRDSRQAEYIASTFDTFPPEEDSLFDFDLSAMP